MPLPAPAQAHTIQNKIETIVAKKEYRIHDDNAESVLDGIGQLAQQLVSFVRNFLNQLSDTNPFVFYLVLLGCSSALLYLAWWNVQQLRLSALRPSKIKRYQSEKSQSRTALANQIRQELEEAIKDERYIDIVRALFRLHVITHEDILRKNRIAIGSLESVTVQEVLHSFPEQQINEGQRAKIKAILEKSFYDNYLLSKAEVNEVALVLANKKVVNS